MQDPGVSPKKPATNDWITNSNLTEEQKAWIQENTLKGRVREGTKTAWKCSICGSALSSAVVLRKHFRDVHKINPAKQSSEKGRGKDFMAEVRSSKTILGRAAECKCKQCETILKSKSGLSTPCTHTSALKSIIAHGNSQRSLVEVLVLR